MSDFIGDQGNNTITGTSGDDLIKGLGGIDMLSGLAGVDNILGGGGSDQLDGGAGADTLKGGGGTDTLYGRDGDDILKGGAGSDTLDGGEDGDTYQVLDTDAGTVDVFSDTGTVGTDVIDATEVEVLVLGSNFDAAGSGIESILGNAVAPLGIISGGSAVNWDFTGMLLTNVAQIEGSSAADEITGTAGIDKIKGRGGNDELNGGGGGDNLNGGAGDDTLNGGAGADTLKGGGGDDSISGGAGGDTMHGGLGIDTLDYESAPESVIINLNAGTASGDGSDTFTGIENVIGSDGFNDTITGDALDNVLIGLGGNDTINSGDGNNILIGNAGNDILTGGTGTDFLRGNDGNDILTGGTGKDLLRGGAGDDTMSGGAGRDTVDYSDAVELLTITLGPTGSASPTSTGNGTDTVSDVENITGSDFNDAIIGNASANVLKGGAGDDTMDGAAGDDTLNGGLGNDGLTGTSGDDTFVFNSALGASNVDSIAVFEGAGAGGGDVISLDDAIFTTLTGGLTLNKFVSAASGPVAADANDFILYDQTTGALYYDADGNGAGDAVQFATLSDSPDTLAFGDFSVI